MLSATSSPADRSLSNRFTLIALALAIAMTLPSLLDGFILDDVFTLAIIEKWYPDLSHPFDVYEDMVAYVNLPWWASQDIKISFLRPLSSALLRLDHAVFGRWSVGWKLHSLLWLTLLILLISRLYRRLPIRVAGLALLIFALDESHGYTAGWLANRHAMVATALGCLGLLAHITWRRERSRRGLVVAIVAFIAALAAGEMAVPMLGFALAFELVAGPGSWRDRFRGMIPLFSLGGAYVILYKALGKGASGVGAYVDPATEPLRFLATAFERIPILMGGALLGPPPDMAAVTQLRPVLIGVGWLAIVAFAAATWLVLSRLESESRKEVSWLLVGAAFSVVPLVATLPGHRQLLPTMIGLAPLIASAISALWTDAFRSPGVRFAARAAAILLLIIHLPVASAGRLFMQYGLGHMHRSIDSILDQIEPLRDDENLVMLRAPDIATMLFGPILNDYKTDHPHSGKWAFLSAAPISHRLRRLDDGDLELEAVDGEMIATVFENFWPPPRPFAAGDIFTSPFFTVTVVSVGDIGPTKLRFSLEDLALRPEATRLLTWQDGRVEPTTWPDPQETRSLDHSPSPVALPGT